MEPPFRVYVLDPSLPEDHIARLLHTFTTTSSFQAVPADPYLHYEAHTPSRLLSTDSELVDYHFETRHPDCPVDPILAIDAQTAQDDTVKLVAKPEERDEVELSDEEEGDPALPAPSTISCRLEPGYVNLITANLSIGNESVETYVELAGPDGVFRGFGISPAREVNPNQGGVIMLTS